MSADQRERLTKNGLIVLAFVWGLGVGLLIGWFGWGGGSLLKGK